jgi:cytochrome c peroxidase
MLPDPSNRVSGVPAAIALGRQLFFDTRLSRDGTRSCATCHDPAKSFADGRPRSLGHERLDRNAIALANLRLNAGTAGQGLPTAYGRKACARSSTPRNSA